MKYIDTSAFVKHYGKSEIEKGRDKVTELISKAKNGEEVLISSVFMLGEAISVFDRWVRLKVITKEESEKIISKFLVDVRELNETGGLFLETVDPIFIMFSIDFILRYHVGMNDAVHLYTALINKNMIEEFISSDKMLNKAAEAEGLIVFDPEE